MRYPLILTLALALPLVAQAKPDIERGKRLHDQKCMSCHVERYGGDGSQIYLRKNRLIHDRAALDQRVAMCNSMVNAGLFPEDEESIAAWLAQRYYKFK